MSKGSKPRPIQDRKKFEENWDKIFNKQKKAICDNFGRCNCTEEAGCDYLHTKESSQFGDH